MSRLSDRFRDLKARNERALICYVVAGDPSPSHTIEIVKALDSACVDAIELGIPFSDPLADGPSIQAGSQRALDNGITVGGVLDVLRGIRETCQIPVVLMTYFNPTLRYGLERFAADSAKAGADGVIQTDLTPEEAGAWMNTARAAGLDTVFLLAPTSTQDRIDVVSRISNGFLYCVSRTGVTGARNEVPVELTDFVSRVREGISRNRQDELPVCVGFGISRPEHVRSIGEFADGVVVGSALVDLIANNADNPRLCDEVTQFAAGLKQATRAV